MDVFTHFVLPYLVVYGLVRDQRVALAAGVGGFAPDLDSLTVLVAFWDPLYFLGHRGFSHSLLGAPLYAAGAVLLFRAPFWRRILPVAEQLRFGWRLGLVAVIASYTHLTLDWLTMWGVPLLYPWTDARFTAGWFFYSVTAMVPTSLYMVWRIARGRDTPRARRVALVLLVATLLAAGGVRAATYPRDAEFAVAHPAAGEWTWTTLARDESGWNATFYSWGRPIGSAEFPAPEVRDPRALEALALAQTHIEYRAFSLYTAGPEVALVEAREDGGWNVTFLNLMERAQAERSPWFPFAEEAGRLRLAVLSDGRIVELDPSLF